MTIHKNSFNPVPPIKQVNISRAFAKKAVKENTDEYKFLQVFKKLYPDWTFHTRDGEQIFL